jgi:hypothetical protein
MHAFACTTNTPCMKPFRLLARHMHEHACACMSCAWFQACMSCACLANMHEHVLANMHEHVLANMHFVMNIHA